MNNKEQLLREGKIKSVIFRLAIPLVISQLINVMYNIVDRIYIGNIPIIGEDALAGLGITFPVLMIVSAFAALFGMGGAPLASIKLGQGKKNEAKNIMVHSLIMLLLIGVILTLILIIFNEGILILFGAKKEIIGYAHSYMLIYALGTTSVMLTLGLNSYISAQGFSKTAMMTVLIGAIINIILDPIFIYLLDMGVSGAALATIISQTISAIYVLKFLTSNKPIFKLSFTKFNLNYKTILSIAALGISPFIMQSTESLVQITFNIQVKNYGGNDYVIYINIITIMLLVMQIIMLPLMGLAQGATPVISYNYGAGKIERVKEAFKILLITSLIYSFAFYLIIFIAPNLFIRIFNSNPNVLQIAPNIFRIFFIGISIMGIQIACQNTFMALKQPVISLFLALLRKIVLLIPLTLILPKYFGINGVFYAEAIADIVAVIITAIVFALSFNKILLRKSY